MFFCQYKSAQQVITWESSERRDSSDCLGHFDAEGFCAAVETGQISFEPISREKASLRTRNSHLRCHCSEQMSPHCRKDSIPELSREPAYRQCMLQFGSSVPPEHSHRHVCFPNLCDRMKQDSTLVTSLTLYEIRSAPISIERGEGTTLIPNTWKNVKAFNVKVSDGTGRSPRMKVSGLVST